MSSNGISHDHQTMPRESKSSSYIGWVNTVQADTSQCFQMILQVLNKTRQGDTK